MLKWIARRRYNLFDVVWLAMATLAWRDHEWLALGIFVTAGAIISGVLEAMAKRAA